MNRLLAVVCLLALSTSAYAQTSGKPGSSAPATPETAPAPAAPTAPGAALDREQIRREVMDDVRKQLDKEREQLRDEIRAQIATQTANRALEEEFQFTEEKRRLELFTVDGYYRLRPELFYKFDLNRGADSSGATLFPQSTFQQTKTLADANMRWRLEPTLNVSEDIRIRSQIDMLDRVILGSTPQGAFGVTDYDPIVVGSTSQIPPEGGRNWLSNNVTVRRVYGEVTTPVGQFLFGRMGSQWGLGMLANSGNCVDCDYGDTVDRIAFVSMKIADHYIVPMIDFVSEGPTSIRTNEYFGQPFDRNQLDDARDYAIAIARRDTDLELNRKLGAGQNVLNYGLYFTYRTQRWDLANQQTSPFDVPSAPAYVPRKANIYVPDLWLRFQTPKLRLEFEVAGVFGKIGTMQNAVGSGNPDQLSQAVTLTQLGAVAQGEYKVLDSLGLNFEVGFASGDGAYGMGNYPGRGVTVTKNPGTDQETKVTGGTHPGSIEGPQFCLNSDSDLCPRGVDHTINNFRFNRDYRIDLILWREIFQGVTDAIYVKPGVKYELTEGLGFWANIIYSRAVSSTSTPSSHLDSNGNPAGSADLGVEIDGGLRYESGDGFMASLAYGVLFPLAGLNNVPNAASNTSTTSASTAQTVRAWFVIKY